jgi:[ribosomal protein S18]-alanine N-acetyltransferase
MDRDAKSALPPGLIVRAFEPADATAAASLSRVSPGASLWPAEAYAFAPESGVCGWVAVMEGEMTGFLVAQCAADEAEILNLVVAPSLRRRGLATSLTEAAFECLGRRGARRVFLEVRASNLAAIRFYEKIGFAAAGRRSAYYDNPREDALCMALLLSA